MTLRKCDACLCELSRDEIKACETSDEAICDNCHAEWQWFQVANHYMTQNTWIVVEDLDDETALIKWRTGVAHDCA